MASPTTTGGVSSVSKPTLYYFPMAGRAEVARILLEDAGVEYDFVPISFQEWPEKKASLMAAGKLPFGQLPLYEEPGLSLVQSNAIARHLAKKYGYFGSNDHEAARVDQTFEGVNDMLEVIAKVFWFTPAEKQAEEKEKLVNETLPKHLTAFVKLLEKNGSNGFLVGDKLSVADVALWVALQLAFLKAPDSKEPLLQAFPQLQTFLDGISARERILSYLTRDVYPSAASRG